MHESKLLGPEEKTVDEIEEREDTPQVPLSNEEVDDEPSPTGDEEGDGEDEEFLGEE